jgi:hypothetical protein
VLCTSKEENQMNKMLGLLTFTAAVLMAFATPVSATTLTAPAGTTYTGEIKAETENGHFIFHNAYTTWECNSFISFKVEQHGAGVTVGGKISSLTFPTCTGDTVAVNQAGVLEMHTGSNGHGIVTLSGSAWTIFNHAFGGTCIYTTSSTSIGTLTPAPISTGHATLDISASIPRTGGTLGVFCGNTGTWTGNYKFTTPTGMRIS